MPDTIGWTSTRSMPIASRIRAMTASKASPSGTFEGDAAHVGLVRDGGGQHLRGDGITERQRGRAHDSLVEGDRRRARNAEAIDQRAGFGFIEQAAGTGGLAP